MLMFWAWARWRRASVAWTVIGAIVSLLFVEAVVEQNVGATVTSAGAGEARFQLGEDAGHAYGLPVVALGRSIGQG